MADITCSSRHLTEFLIEASFCGSELSDSIGFSDGSNLIPIRGGIAKNVLQKYANEGKVKLESCSLNKGC